MESTNRWYFTKEILENTPTRKCGIEASKELSYRQQAANFIQDMGQRLQVTQLCINTAIVYMHRFYMFHSFTKLHRNQLAVAALFLAAKVEEQPRKLEHVVRVAHKCLHRGEDLDPKSDAFGTKCTDLVSQENMMLQTLGFDIAIDHPHTYVVKLLQLVKASKDLAQTSYFMATNSLHLTTMCLQYLPTVVACVCIHLACKWSNWKIEPCSEGKEWYYYVDKSVTPELLEELTKDFLAVLEKSPNRLKRRVGPENNKDGQTSQSRSNEEIVGRVEAQIYDICIEPMKKDMMSPIASTSSAPFDGFVKEEISEKSMETNVDSVTEPVLQIVQMKKPKTEAPHSISLAVYREKQEKKQLEQKTLSGVSASTALPDFSLTAIQNTSASKFAPEKIIVSNQEKPILIPEKLMAASQEKRLSHKSLSTSNELVPKRIPDKSSHKNLTSSSLSDAVSVDKVNHIISKSAVAQMPQVNHHAPKIPPVQPAVKGHSKNDLVHLKVNPEALKPNDPFVLLTRMDQTQLEKKISSDIKTGPHLNLPVNTSSKNVAAPSHSELRSKSRHAPAEPAVPALTNWGKDMLKNTDSHSSVKHKSKAGIVLQNNHNDSQHSTQGNIVKHSPSWDPTKANGSKLLEQPVVDLPFSPYLLEAPKPVEKTGEVHVKHERREKRHKHSVHSNKDKIANHVSDTAPDHGMSSSLKITIPKEKLVLSGIRPDSHQKVGVFKEESSRTTLKIKIPKPKPPVPESLPVAVPSLKLVITKDKNAGSYSTSSRKSSRKRDRSPSSKGHNSRSSGKSGKLAKVDSALMPDSNAGHLNLKNSSFDSVYDTLSQQPYALPTYTVPPMFQSQYCPPYPMLPTNMSYAYPHFPPQPHPTNSAPPLPRDPPLPHPPLPPPPLPPQPPMTSE